MEMEWKEWQAPKYHWPTPKMLKFLSSEEGYNLVLELLSIYSRTMPQPLGDALARTTGSFERWLVAVSIARHGLTPDLHLLSTDIGIPETQVEAILGNMGIPEITAVAELAGRWEFCQRACENDPDPDCFNKCMQEG